MKLFLNCLDNEVTLNKKQYLLNSANRLGITNVVDIKARQGDEPTDYILNIEPFGFLKGNKWTGVWEIDLLCDRIETSPSHWAVSDVVFLAGMSYSDRLKGFEDKIVYLFQACDPTFKRIGEPEYDFIQCGSMDSPLHDERSRLVSLLREKYTFAEFGKNHKPETYIQNLSKARVQFIRSMKSGVADGEIAQRFFECLAIGPVLTNYVEDLEHLGLVEGTDYYSYRNDKELLLKFKYLINNPSFADTMAKNGREKALMMHTYEHRLVSILNIIHETKT